MDAQGLPFPVCWGALLLLAVRRRKHRGRPELPELFALGAAPWHPAGAHGLHGQSGAGGNAAGHHISLPWPEDPALRHRLRAFRRPGHLPR
eukprot:1646764-Alexandrium_andersonii.AAC.1